MNTTDNLYYDWPLITVVIGGHQPQWVEDVIERVSKLDHQALVVMMDCMVILARDEVGRN